MGLRDDLAVMRHYQSKGLLDSHMRGTIPADQRDFDPHRDGDYGTDDTSPHAKPSTNWGAIKARGLGD